MTLELSAALHLRLVLSRRFPSSDRFGRVFSVRGHRGNPLASSFSKAGHKVAGLPPAPRTSAVDGSSCPSSARRLAEGFC